MNILARDLEEQGHSSASLALFFAFFSLSKEDPYSNLNLSLSLSFLTTLDRISDLSRARAREEEGARKQHGTRNKTRRSRATFPWS